MYSLPQVQSLESRTHLSGNWRTSVPFNPLVFAGETFRVGIVTPANRPQSPGYVLDINRNGEPDAGDLVSAGTATTQQVGSETYIDTEYRFDTTGLAPGAYLIFPGMAERWIGQGGGAPLALHVLEPILPDSLDPADDLRSTMPTLTPGSSVVHTLTSRFTGDDRVDSSRIEITQPTRIQIRALDIRGSIPVFELLPLGSSTLATARLTHSNQSYQPTIDGILQPGSYVLNVFAERFSRYTLDYSATPTSSGYYASVGPGREISGAVAAGSGITTVELYIDANHNGRFEAVDGAPLATVNVNADLRFQSSFFRPAPVGHPYYVFAIAKNASGQIIDSTRVLYSAEGTEPLQPLLITDLNTTLNQPPSIAGSLPLSFNIRSRIPDIALGAQDFTLLVTFATINGTPLFHQYVPIRLSLTPNERKPFQISLPLDSRLQDLPFSVHLQELTPSFNPELRDYPVVLAIPGFSPTVVRSTPSLTSLTFFQGSELTGRFLSDALNPASSDPFILDSNRNGIADPDDLRAQLTRTNIGPGTTAQNDVTFDTSSLAPGTYTLFGSYQLVFPGSGLTPFSSNNAVGVTNPTLTIAPPLAPDTFDPADNDPSTMPLLSPNQRPRLHTLHTGDPADLSLINVSQFSRVRFSLRTLAGTLPSTFTLEPILPNGLPVLTGNLSPTNPNATLDAFLPPGSYKLTLAGTQPSSYTIAYTSTPARMGLNINRTDSSNNIADLQLLFPTTKPASALIYQDKNSNGRIDKLDGPPVATLNSPNTSTSLSVPYTTTYTTPGSAITKSITSPDFILISRNAKNQTLARQPTFTKPTTPEPSASFSSVRVASSATETRISFKLRSSTALSGLYYLQVHLNRVDGTPGINSTQLIPLDFAARASNTITLSLPPSADSSSPFSHTTLTLANPSNPLLPFASLSSPNPLKVTRVARI